MLDNKKNNYKIININFLIKKNLQFKLKDKEDSQYLNIKR